MARLLQQEHTLFVWKALACRHQKSSTSSAKIRKAVLLKSIVCVAVLITSMVVSTVTAQDTLRVQSLRSVDLCSDKRRWLLAVSLGNIRFADSLESFDITIGFNKSIIRPTDVLKEGTLSAQMSNGPTMNTVVPGEMRIFGFNVARSVSGNQPLVAVSGDFLGVCTEVGELSVPYPPDFNTEFKKRYTVNVLDEIQPVWNRRFVPNLGCTFNVQRDSFLVGEIQRTYVSTINRSGNSDDVKGQLGFQIQDDSNTLTYVGSSCDNCDIDSVGFPSSNSVSVYYSIDSATKVNEPIVFRTTLKRWDGGSEGKAKLIATVRNRDTCSCSIPGLLDTVDIVMEKSVVGIESSPDDGSCTIETKEGLIIGKCLHHGMKELELYDLYGNRVLATSKHGNESVVLSTMVLSHGLHFAMMTCGGGWKRKTIVK
ncbi:MAG: hypothetical protein FGM32_04040 [Candidatus Kapabacteria bacterium]|nr:hypothetical protein [Candidatus Kapabacteria bacterium]